MAPVGGRRTQGQAESRGGPRRRRAGRV